MLQRFSIKNIVLVENCHIEFQPGLNVLTGETGSGKSVILASLSLLMGDRLDSSLLRQGVESGTISATFTVSRDSPIISILEHAGIKHALEEELIIRREVFSNGKSRSYINDQSVQLHSIKAISCHLIEACGQHAHMRLLEKEMPLEVLDKWQGIDCSAFQSALSEERKTKSMIERLESNTHRFYEIEATKKAIAEIESAALQEGEEEELFTLFSILSDQEKIGSTIEEIIGLLDEQKHSVLSSLKRAHQLCQTVVSIVPALNSLTTSFERASSEIQEVCFQLEKYRSQCDFSPTELQRLQGRLQQIHELKRKYGQGRNEIMRKKKELEAHLGALEQEIFLLEELKKKLPSYKKITDACAIQLTTQRKKAAPLLAKKLTEELRLLNMPQAILEITITSANRSESGDDAVAFMLQPNKGEKQIDIQQGASGGELARIMLALQIVLVDKKTVPTLLFDEIDANIGGQTATLIGEKLKHLSKLKQVICITHFPQLAVQADAHFKIQKHETEDRTVSTIELLESQSLKMEEITRMLGGQDFRLVNK